MKSNMKKSLLLTCMLFLMSITMNAQVKITRQYLPIELDVKVKRCVVSGNQGYIDLVFTNYTGHSIGEFFILPYNGDVKYSETVAYDDEGKVYYYQSNGSDIHKITLGGKDGKSYNTFPEDVPVKMRIELTNISEFATEFTLLNINFRGYLSPNNNDDGSITIRNIPITRVE